MEIKVDNRESKSIYDAVVRKFKGVKVNREELQIGDYLLPNDIVVERKEDDIISSIQGKRIFRQLENMQDYKKRYIIHINQNLYKLFFKSRLKWIDDVYYGFLASASLDFDTNVLVVPDKEGFVKLLYAIYKNTIKTGKSAVPISKPKKGIPLSKRKKLILANISGVSFETADRLIKKYKTISNISNLTLKELIDNKGIGKKTAQAIIDELN